MLRISIHVDLHTHVFFALQLAFRNIELQVDIKHMLVVVNHI